MKYLLIHEDGTIETTEVTNDEVYLPSIDAGIIEVVRALSASKFELLSIDGQWMDL